jgi:nucleoside-diphosphate-sugar epimerase
MTLRQKKALVLGAGGFIGSHLVNRLRREGFWVRGVDLKYTEFSRTAADDFVIADLRDAASCRQVVDTEFDEIYQLAADMGGAGYLFTGENDADVMHNSATINLNILDSCRRRNVQRIFYSSSACVYPEHNQLDPTAPITREDSVYPANPDSEYGWEKLFSERLYLAYQRNFGFKVRIARYHNIFGPEGTWTGGREKAPAAICRKVAETPQSGEIEIWGDGQQTRSFLYVDECLEGTIRLTRSNWSGPVNIGSDEMVTLKRAGADADRHFRQEHGNSACSRVAWGTWSQLSQRADREATRLETECAPTRRSRVDLCLVSRSGRAKARARSVRGSIKMNMRGIIFSWDLK